MAKANNKIHTAAITQRFLLLCEEAVVDGLCKNRSAFLESVGEYQSNYSKFEDGIRAPTLEQIVKACELYGYSANWLVLNIGDKKLKASDKKPLEGRVTDLEVQMNRLRRIIEKK